jgi:hypothetical protein
MAVDCLSVTVRMHVCALLLSSHTAESTAFYKSAAAEFVISSVQRRVTVMIKSDLPLCRSH